MKNIILYRVVRVILKPIFAFLYRPKIIGKENIIHDEAVIYAGNHQHNLDSLFLAYVIKRTVHFIAKKEMVESRLGFAFRRIGLIPVDRTKKNPLAIKTALDYLSKGAVIGIFPEGTFNRTGDVIMPFKFGAVKLAHDSQAYLVPFTITGKYGLFGLKKRAIITFLKPYKVKDDLVKENKKLEMIISRQLIKKEK